MNRQDISKLQTCVLKVNIHCDGCKKKVKKLLQKIEGVYSTKIDAETGKVTVTGNVDPTTLVKKLVKSGKRAEIWSFQKGSSNFHGSMNNQFKNIVRIEDSKLGQNNHHHKAHKHGGKDQQQQQKMGNSYKDPMAMATLPKDKKYVKNNLAEEEFDVSDDEFDDEDELDDEDYDDDEFDDDDDGDGDHGFNDVRHGDNKKMLGPMMSKGHGSNVPNGMINVHAINKGGDGSNKKGGVIDIPIVLKGKSEKTDPKKGNNGKKKGRSGEKTGDGGGKSGKEGGGFLGYGKKIVGLFGFGKNKSCKGGECEDSQKGKAKGSSTNNGPKKGGGRKDDFHEFSSLEEGFHDINVSKPGKGGGSGSVGLKMGPVGPIGPVNVHPNYLGQMSHVNGLPGQIFPGHVGPVAHGGQMGNYPIGHMGNIPVVPGLPAPTMMNGGYYQGAGQENPYNQQSAMMMNQQRAIGNGMMFGGPLPMAMNMCRCRLFLKCTMVTITTLAMKMQIVVVSCNFPRNFELFSWLIF